MGMCCPFSPETFTLESVSPHGLSGGSRGKPSGLAYQHHAHRRMRARARTHTHTHTHTHTRPLVSSSPARAGWLYALFYILAL